MKKIMTISPPPLPFLGNSSLLFSLCQLLRMRICFLSRYSTSAVVVDDKITQKGIIKCMRLENLIKARSKSGSLNLQVAVCLFDSVIQMRPLPSICAFNHLIGAVSKMKHYSIVVSMCKHIMGCKEIQLDIFTMNSWLNGLCNSKQVDLGFSVLTMIFKLGLQPNAYTMNTLLLGICNESKINEA
ncbi:Uncharacterized protein TCM_020281 [Theobroma cacao]|uniref:Pentatricopeptide repeat-containing protein n=1 Tax=Theobroma cacao TaxID=3641 RepID=A0A061EK59_THECC|nr:Uncharacterized protein TCM_020281 [Theobroma cacao]